MRATGASTRHGRRVVGAQRALPLLEHEQARPHPRPRHRGRAGAAAAADRGERRDARELLAARVLGNFGLEWEQIQAINPRCLLVRMPAFGLSGPWRDNVGFAQTMEQVTGMAWITGHRDDQPRIQQGPSDPNAGMHAAFALIVGFAEREATGRGSLLEVTMVEGALNAAVELVLEATAYGNLLERDGNRSPNVAPQGLYAGRDDETWLAISVATDEQWRGLVAALGRPGVGDRSGARDLRRPASPPRRARRAPRRRGAPSATSAEAAELLVAHGVPAGGRARPALDVRPSAAAGARVLRGDRPPGRGPAARRRRCRSGSRRSTGGCARRAPTLGQHNHEILVDDLGVDEADLRRARGRAGHRHPPPGRLNAEHVSIGCVIDPRIDTSSWEVGFRRRRP